MNKYKYTRKQRIFKIYCKKIRRKIWNVTKPILMFLFKALGWLILLGIILIITSYDDYGDNANFWAVIGFYIGIIVQHYTDDSNYKTWENRAKYDEFYSRFCNQYHPHIIGYLIMFAIGVKWFNTVGLIICVMLPYLFDLWERRFITSDIKQDMILEKLNAPSSKHF